MSYNPSVNTAADFEVTEFVIEKFHEIVQRMTVWNVRSPSKGSPAFVARLERLLSDLDSGLFPEFITRENFLAETKRLFGVAEIDVKQMKEDRIQKLKQASCPFCPITAGISASECPKHSKNITSHSPNN